MWYLPFSITLELKKTRTSVSRDPGPFHNLAREGWTKVCRLLQTVSYLGFC
jgi:hypothetical protein